MFKEVKMISEILTSANFEVILPTFLSIANDCPKTTNYGGGGGFAVRYFGQID